MRFHRAHDGESERGATLVEFTLIAPIIFLMFGAMFDIGLAVIGSSVATNTAREGARVGIIHYDNADLVGSPNNTLVKAAANSKLVGLITPDTTSGPAVIVKCLDGGGTHPIQSCAAATVQVDYDLIEVTVKWKSISPTHLFTANGYTDVARMVITGGIGGGGTACTTSGGTVSWSPSSASVDEGASGTTNSVSLTTTHDGSTACATTVAFSTADGSATTANNDYFPIVSALLSFAPGQSSTTVVLDSVVRGDATTEANETFTVAMQPATMVNGTIGTGTATITIVNDDGSLDTTKPTPGTPEYSDENHDGFIDQVLVPFSEPIVNIGNTNSWTISNQPSGMKANPSNVNLDGTGTKVVLTWTGNDVSNSASTGPTNVRLAMGANAVQDVATNVADPFSNLLVLDRAGPVPIAINIANGQGSANKTPDASDTIAIDFSEPVDRQSICGNASVPWQTNSPGVLSSTGQIIAAMNENGGGADTLTASSGAGVCSAGLSFGSVQFTAEGYITADVTFGGGAAAIQSEISWDPTTSRLTLTLGTRNGAASGQNAANVTYTPDATLKDLVGNAAAGSRTESETF